MPRELDRETAIGAETESSPDDFTARTRFVDPDAMFLLPQFIQRRCLSDFQRLEEANGLTAKQDFPFAISHRIEF